MNAHREAYAFAHAWGRASLPGVTPVAVSLNQCIYRASTKNKSSTQPTNVPDGRVLAKLMRRIDLSHFAEVGLIICVPSGVCYTNQAAGFSCLHPEEEGVFCPLPVEPGKAELYALRNHFKGLWNSLTQKDADLVDTILHRSAHEYMKVDRARLTDSYEAWVYVLITGITKPKFGELFSGFGECKGVLTWPNSD